MEKQAIGRLDRRIRIYSISETQSDTGAAGQTADLLTTVWAKVETPQTGSDEAYHAGKQIEVRRVDFTIRWMNGLTTRSYITWRSENYDIENVLELDRNRYIKLQTKLRK